MNSQFDITLSAGDGGQRGGSFMIGDGRQRGGSFMIGDSGQRGQVMVGNMEALS